MHRTLRYRTFDAVKSWKSAPKAPGKRFWEHVFLKIFLVAALDLARGMHAGFILLGGAVKAPGCSDTLTACDGDGSCDGWRR
eukprot:gene17071-biopygen23317